MVMVYVVVMEMVLIVLHIMVQLLSGGSFTNSETTTSIGGCVSGGNWMYESKCLIIIIQMQILCALEVLLILMLVRNTGNQHLDFDCNQESKIMYQL